MKNRHPNVSKDHRRHRRFLGWYIEVCFSKWCSFWISKVSNSKKYSVNTLIYVDFELEVKKVDGNFDAKQFKEKANWEEVKMVEIKISQGAKPGHGGVLPAAKEDCIQSAYWKKEYKPSELKIVKTFRFDGMTNPEDETEVFAIEANDGTKGTLVMSYSAIYNHEVELIKKIPTVE